MSRWRALAAELIGGPGSPQPPKPGGEVSGVSGVLSIGERRQPEGDKAARLALARDLFEERAAVREHDGGQPRAEAERAALEDTARALGLAVDEMRTALADPPLDAEGLPFAPCTRCGGGDFWKPAEHPFEGPGWRCTACTPPEAAQWRHACAVP